jgi:hypothetical protein
MATEWLDRHEYSEVLPSGGVKSAGRMMMQIHEGHQKLIAQSGIQCNATPWLLEANKPILLGLTKFAHKRS